MIVLSLSRKIQRFIGVYRGDLSDPKEYLIKLALNIVAIGSFCILQIGSLNSFWVNFMDFESSTNTMIVLTAATSGVGCYIGITMNTKSISKLFNILQNLANESLKYRGFFGFFEAEHKSHLLSKWFTMFMMLFFTFGTVAVFLGMSIWCIHLGNFDTLTWIMPYNIILPIDKSTILGWYCEFWLQAIGGYVFVLTITSTVTFFGGCCYYIQACLKQFKHMFDEVNKKIQAENEQIEEDLFDIIIFHNKVFEVFETVAENYSVAIFFHLICNILFFAAALYQSEMSLGHVGISLLFNVLCVAEGLSYTFILCYFANLASYSMDEMANVVYNSDWYCQPPQLQKILILIIARAQIPNVFMGLKFVDCSLESFTKLSKTAATCYIMFRNLTRLHSSQF